MKPSYGQQKIKDFLPDPKEQEIINIIRNHRRSGKTIYAIAKYLNDNGYKTRHGKDWNQVQVKRILTRPTGSPNNPFKEEHQRLYIIYTQKGVDALIHELEELIQ